MKETQKIQELDFSNLPGMNRGAALRQDMMLSFISIIIFIAIVLFLKKVIQKRDKKNGKKESHPFRTMFKWYYIVVALLSAIFVWTGSLPITSFWQKAIVVGIPLGVIIAASTSPGWRSTLSEVFGCVVVSAIGVLLLNFATKAGFEYADQVIKILSSVLYIISAVAMYKNDGELIASEPTYYSSSYSSYSSTSSSSSANTDPFSGGDFRRKKDFMGNIEYIDKATGKVIAKGKEDYWGKETIKDNEGKVILQEKDGFFGSRYEDANGNTRYTKDTNIFGDHEIKDSSGNTKFVDDALDRWITGNSDYKKR